MELRSGSRAGYGALVGKLIGSGVGLIGYMLSSMTDSPGHHPARFIPIGALEGAGIGALVGAYSDGWKPINLKGT